MRFSFSRRIAELQHPALVAAQLVLRHREVVEALYAQWALIHRAWFTLHRTRLQCEEERKQFTIRWRLWLQLAWTSLESRRAPASLEPERANDDSRSDGNCVRLLEEATLRLQSSLLHHERLLSNAVPESYTASQLALHVTQCMGLLSFMERKLMPLAATEDDRIRRYRRRLTRRLVELLRNEQWARRRLEWEVAQEVDKLDVFARLLR